MEAESNPEPDHFESPDEYAEYLNELARRLDIHARENCIGVKATKEVGYAATVLRQIAESMKGQTDDSRPEN